MKDTIAQKWIEKAASQHTMLLKQYPEIPSQEIDDKMALWLGQQPEYMNPFLTMKGMYAYTFLMLELSDTAAGFVC